MAALPAGWTVRFLGCDPAAGDCESAAFQVLAPDGAPTTVEVRTTAQIEHILARELGKGTLEAGDREAIFTAGGSQLIAESLAEVGAVEPLLLLDSRLFRVPGAERRLLEECGLVPGPAGPDPAAGAGRRQHP